MADKPNPAPKSADRKKLAAIRNVIAGRGCYRFQKNAKGLFYHVEDRGKGQLVYQAFSLLEAEIGKQRADREEQLSGLKQARVTQPSTLPVEKLSFAQLKAIVEARSFYQGPVRPEARTLAPSLDANPLLLSEAVIGNDSVEVTFPDGVSMRYPKTHPLAQKLVDVQARLKEVGIDLETDAETGISAPGLETIAEEKTKARSGPPDSQERAPDGAKDQSGKTSRTDTSQHAALKTITGTLANVGESPFKDDPENNVSPFIEITEEDGTLRKEWGVDFPRALEEAGARVGERISADLLGKQWVIVQTREKDEKGKWHDVAKEVQRNAWRITPLDREITQRETGVSSGDIDEALSDRPADDGGSDDGKPSEDAASRHNASKPQAVLVDWHTFIDAREEYVRVQSGEGPEGPIWQDQPQMVDRRFFAGKVNGVDVRFPVTDITDSFVTEDGLSIQQRDGQVVFIGAPRAEEGKPPPDVSLFIAGFHDKDADGKETRTNQHFEVPLSLSQVISRSDDGAPAFSGRKPTQVDEKDGKVVASSDAGFIHGYISSAKRVHSGVLLDVAKTKVFVPSSPQLEKELSEVGLCQDRAPAPERSQAAKESAPPSPSGEKTVTVEGLLVSHGAAPYKDNPKNTGSYFVEIKDAKGEASKYWGADLQKAMESVGAKAGERVALSKTTQPGVKKHKWSVALPERTNSTPAKVQGANLNSTPASAPQPTPADTSQTRSSAIPTSAKEEEVSRPPAPPQSTGVVTDVVSTKVEGPKPDVDQPKPAAAVPQAKPVPVAVKRTVRLNDRTPAGRFPTYTLIDEKGAEEVVTFPEEIGVILEQKCVAGPIQVEFTSIGSEMIPTAVHDAERSVPFDELKAERAEFIKKNGRPPLTMPRIPTVDIGGPIAEGRDLDD